MSEAAKNSPCRFGLWGNRGLNFPMVAKTRRGEPAFWLNFWDVIIDLLKIIFELMVRREFAGGAKTGNPYFVREIIFDFLGGRELAGEKTAMMRFGL